MSRVRPSVRLRLPRPRPPQPRSVAALLILGATLPLGGCGGPGSFEELARESLATLDGAIPVEGLRDTVEVLRDPWGVPHIYARSPEDLFFAQGFVQAQDRLWQMDMYHRTFAGRLSEILGPSALSHDRLARLLRYRGPWDESEFGSYHPQARSLFQAFADGVNAYVAQAGEDLPVEFKLTGLQPLPWTAETSLLRTQTAMPTGDARNELSLARSVVELGAEEANRRAQPSPWRDLVLPEGVDLSLIGDEVREGLSGLQTGTVRPPLLPRYQSWADAWARENGGAQESSPGSNNWVVSGRLTASGKVMVANDPHRSVGNPSIRYIVHLVAPGWDVIGATEPPLPGVAIGHNGRIAWGLTIVGTDQSDVYVETLNPENPDEVLWRGSWEPLRIVTDTIPVKDGPAEIVELRYSRHGPIFHVDEANNLAYAMRSTMHEPGSAGYLGAMRLQAVQDCVEFLDALDYWKAPTENMVCGDADGNIAWQASALSPRRVGWQGRLPVPGTGEYEWDGFRDDLPRELNPERGWIATANHDIHPPDYDPPLFFKRGPSRGRYDRLEEVLSAGGPFTMGDFQALQHDAYLAASARDAFLFQGWTSNVPEIESGRQLLAGWDGRYQRESAAAALYSFLDREITPSVRTAPPMERQAALEQALEVGLAALREAQGDDPAQWRWGRIHRSEMPHALVSAYDIPAIERSGGSGMVAATGATFREIVDFSDLDASAVTNVPGQSGQPGSPYYDNLTESYARGEYFPLLYSRGAVEARAEHRLLLIPR